MENKKYIMVTGASSGIGEATAKAFASRGWNLILVALANTGLDEVKKTLQEKYSLLDIVIREVDLTNLPAVYELYESVKEYDIATLCNIAGFGDSKPIKDADVHKLEGVINVNATAVAILSSLYVKDYHDVDGAQLINMSSTCGYSLVDGYVTYSAAKFFVSAFSECLMRELRDAGDKLQVKVMSPSKAATAWFSVSEEVDQSQIDFDQRFKMYHTSEEIAEFIMELYDSDKTVGMVDRETLAFSLEDALLPYAKSHNKK